MSLYWSIMLFNLRVSTCVHNFPAMIYPFTMEEKQNICIAWTLERERDRQR